MTIRVEAAVFYRVVDPITAVVAIRDYRHAVLRIAQTTLRATLGQHQLDDLLANQHAINERLKQIIDTATEPWGVQRDARHARMPGGARAGRIGLCRRGGAHRQVP